LTDKAIVRKIATMFMITGPEGDTSQFYKSGGNSSFESAVERAVSSEGAFCETPKLRRDLAHKGMEKLILAR
jgi:hypothetical protein